MKIDITSYLLGKKAAGGTSGGGNNSTQYETEFLFESEVAIGEEDKTIYSDEDLKTPEKILVTFDGVAYACDLWFDQFNDICYGNSELWGEEANGNNAPFVINTYTSTPFGSEVEARYWTLVCEDYNTPHTIKVEIITGIKEGASAGGGSKPIELQDKTITENGTYTADAGFDGLGTVSVTVPTEIIVDDEETYNALKNLLEGNIVYAYTVPTGVTRLRDSAFTGWGSKLSGNVYLPNSLEYIGQNAFYGCISARLSKIPDSVNYIGNQAFYNSGVSIESLPASLTSVGESVFYKTSLNKLTIHSGITSIGKYAWQSCTSLKEVTFEGKPSSIYSNAFSSCTRLTVINVPWSEGEVSGAPWGATNATINYNCGEVIEIKFIGEENFTFSSANNAVYAMCSELTGYSKDDFAYVTCTDFTYGSGNVLSEMNDGEFILNISNGKTTGNVSFKKNSNFTSAENAVSWFKGRQIYGGVVVRACLKNNIG